MLFSICQLRENQLMESRNYLNGVNEIVFVRELRNRGEILKVENSREISTF